MLHFAELVSLLEEHKYNTQGFDEAALDRIAPSPDDFSTAREIEYAFEIIVEHQRGMKLFGIPLFSGKLLLPILDPPEFLRLGGSKVILPHGSKDNYPLPGLDWKWAWERWYILMLNDVDECGWLYLLFWRIGSCWHGKYYFGDFVRKRLWVRLRKRPVEDEQEESS